MAYLNEFPNLKPNELNLNWILEQYSSFNDKLQELHDHFDSAINDINASIDEFEREVNNTISEFEQSINEDFNEFKEDINEEVSTISNVIEQVNENIEEYVSENIQSFLWNVVTVTLEKTETVNPEDNATITFDEYAIPEGYASFIVLEYSEQYQNNIWYGGQIGSMTSVAIYPSLKTTVSSGNYTFSMNVHNPVSGGALPVTARIKLLLIPDTQTLDSSN